MLDGAVIVHLLSTAEVSTFQEYADKVFIPYMSQQLQHATRVDVVWNTYLPDSLRRKVSSHAKLPRNWTDFLHDQNNKKEIFALLTSKVIEFVCPPSKVVYVTSGERVISAGSDMTNCNHEEADTRVVVHILNALEQGTKSVKVRNS